MLKYLLCSKENREKTYRTIVIGLPSKNIFTINDKIENVRIKLFAQDYWSTNYYK